MDFSKLRTAVVEFWEFLWPAIMLTATMVAIALYVAPNVVRYVARTLASAMVMPSDQVSETLRFFGLNTLVPFAVVFALLLGLHVVRRVADFVGSITPPQFVFFVDQMVNRVATESLGQRLSERFPGTAHGYELFARAEEFLSGLDANKSKAASEVGHWRQQREKAHDGWSRCKFLLIWTFICFVVESRMAHSRSWGRFWMLLIIISCIGLVFLLKVLYSWYQFVNAVLNAALLAAPASPTATSVEAGSLRRDHPEPDRRWWALRWWPSYASEWHLINVLGPQLGGRIRNLSHLGMRNLR